MEVVREDDGRWQFGVSGNPSRTEVRVATEAPELRCFYAHQIALGPALSATISTCSHVSSYSSARRSLARLADEVGDLRSLERFRGHFP